MALLEQPLNPQQPLNQAPAIEKFQFDGPVTDNETALALVLQNTQRSEKFIASRLWLSEWRIAKSLYEAPVKQLFWRDTMIPRASNAFPLVAQHVRAILDAAMPALFPDDPPLEVAPNEGTPWQVARGWMAVLGYQIKDSSMKAQMRLIVKDAEIFGTGMGKWGWERFTRKRVRYVRDKHPLKKTDPVTGKTVIIHTAESDQLNAVEDEEIVSKPFFKHIEINHVLVDPALREPDIRLAGYVIYRDFLSIRDLNKLRDFEGWNIPSEEELRELAAPPAEKAASTPLESEATAYPAQGHRALPRYIDSSEDPLDHKLEVLEYWTSTMVIAVLQRKRTIRNEANPHGVIPFVSCYWDDVPGTFYSFGIPRRIGGVQTHIQGLRNNRLDDIHMNLMNMWLVKKGTNIAAQPIRSYPGAVFKVDDMESLQPLKKQPILAEAYQEESVLIADAEKTSGANEMLVQGAMPPTGGGRTSMGRTATGAGALAAASNSRVQGFVDVIAEQVMVPVVTAFLRMDREMLDLSLVRKIVGSSLWASMESEYSGDLSVDLCDAAADIELRMLAGSNIAAKKNMATALPLEMQIFSQPAVQQGLQQAGYKTNWLEFVRRVEQSSGWKSQQDMVIKMTPQDQQAAQQNNKAMVNAQATQQRLTQIHGQNMEKLQAQHTNKLSEIDAGGVAQAGSTILVKALERQMEKEETPELGGFSG